MAYPVIPVDSATGSDVCGNAAIRGTAASSDGGGTTITLDGSPDLSGVATDGSAWFQWLHSSAGARNFSKITGKDNTAKTVTLAHAVTGSTSGQTWGINQTLASLNHANSRKLFENNSAAGDAMPGWTVQLQNGHAETITSTITFRRSGDLTDGRIAVTSNFTTTRPVLTSTVNSSMLSITTSVGLIEVSRLHAIGPGTGSTSSRAIGVVNNNSGMLFEDLVIGNSATTDGFAVGISCGNGATGRGFIKNVEVKFCTTGISDGMSAMRMTHINVHHCTTGVIFSWVNILMDLSHSLIHHNSGDGVQVSSGINVSIRHCTIDNNGGDGIEFNANAADWLAYSLHIDSCQITNNGGYALNFTGTGISDAYIAASTSRIFNCNHYLNTSGFSNYNLAFAEGTQNVDPEYVDASTGDYRIGAATKALGFPTGDFPGAASGVRSFMDIGAAQRQEPASGPRPAFASFG